MTYWSKSIRLIILYFQAMKYLKVILFATILIATLSCSEGSETYSDAKYLFIQPNQSTYNVSSDASTIYISINSNTEWEVSVEDNMLYNDWIFTNTSNGTNDATLCITINANDSTLDRVSYIYFKKRESLFNDCQITIKQDGKTSSGGNNTGNDNTGGDNTGSGNTGSGNTGGNDNTGGGSTIQKPSAPTGLTVQNEGNNFIPDVRIRWDAVNNATSYKVYKSSSASGYYSKIGETTYTFYTDNNAPTNGNSAYYKVTAVNSAGESAYSSYAKYSAVSNDKAFAPATPTVSASGSSTISLSWSCATGTGYGSPKSYEVYKRNPATSQFELLTTTSSRSYSDRNTHPGINRYGVIAINDVGKSAMGIGYSNEVPLSRPTSFSASKSGSSVKFTWSKVSNATGYQIYSSSSANGSYFILEQIDDASTTSKSVYYPANSGTTTYFKIRAYWQESYGGSIVYSDYSTYKYVTF